MLDDKNVIKQRDPDDTLGFAAGIYADVAWPVEILSPDNDGRETRNVVIAGMGGSSLAADMLNTMIKDWFGVPIEVVKGYELPGYAWQNTLVIASSHSGNTEETLSCYRQARERGCQVAVLSTGGSLGELAETDGVTRIMIPTGGQPRMAIFKHMRALLKLLENFHLIDDDLYTKMEQSKDWLEREANAWHPDVPIHENYAKQLALIAVGKTPIFYGGPKTAPVAYKWKISWNENAKNTAWMNQYPEFNHNEFIGWSSHPVEKPFAVFDIVSAYDSARIHERMDLSDRLLSGRRPKAVQISLRGESLLQEMLWGCVLADYVSIYVAILNGVNPAPVELVERFKKELS